jgi:hypothetical protein
LSTSNCSNRLVSGAGTHDGLRPAHWVDDDDDDHVAFSRLHPLLTAPVDLQALIGVADCRGEDATVALEPQKSWRFHKARLGPGVIHPNASGPETHGVYDEETACGFDD